MAGALPSCIKAWPSLHLAKSPGAMLTLSPNAVPSPVASSPMSASVICA